MDVKSPSRLSKNVIYIEGEPKVNERVFVKTNSPVAKVKEVGCNCSKIGFTDTSVVLDVKAPREYSEHSYVRTFIVTFTDGAEEMITTYFKTIYDDSEEDNDKQEKHIQD